MELWRQQWFSYARIRIDKSQRLNSYKRTLKALFHSSEKNNSQERCEYLHLIKLSSTVIGWKHSQRVLQWMEKRLKDGVAATQASILVSQYNLVPRLSLGTRLLSVQYKTYLPLSNQQSKTSLILFKVPRPVLDGIVILSVLKMKRTYKSRWYN